MPAASTEAVQAKTPRRRKGKIRVVWDAAFESVGQSKLGDHIWWEVPSAVKKSPFIFLICLGAILLFYSKGRDKSERIADLRKDKSFLQQSIIIEQQRIAGKDDKLRESDRRILELIQERNKADSDAKVAEQETISWR